VNTEDTTTVGEVNDDSTPIDAEDTITTNDDLTTRMAQPTTASNKPNDHGHHGGQSTPAVIAGRRLI
jgi:hypothetical protein